jgi:hypothetical protein
MQKPGMLDPAYGAYLLACSQAGVRENIVQTVGAAPLSAGFHAADGKDAQGNDYCAAVDISVLHPIHLTGAQVSALLLAMFHNGFAPFWRHEGVFMNGPHIHALWCDCAMKPELRAQFHDFCHARNGLVGHALDTFWSQFMAQAAWETGVEGLKAAFFAHNPVNG